MHRVISLFILLIIFFTNTHAHARPVKIVIFGSEVNMGEGVDPQYHFSKQLSEILNKNGYIVDVIDKSQKWLSTEDAQKAVDTEVIALKPDVVIVDICSDDELIKMTDVGLIRYNLELILWKLSKANIRDVLLVGCIKKWNTDPEYGKQYHNIYKYVAGLYKIRLYRHFFDGYGNLPALMQKGSKSPSKLGLKYITEAIYPYIKIYVDNVARRVGGRIR